MRELLIRYTLSEIQIIERFFDKLAATTNKTGKMLDSKKIKIIQSWKPFPPQVVIESLEVYLSMNIDAASYGKGKNEKYVLGIIRNKAGGVSDGRNDSSKTGVVCHNEPSANNEGERLRQIIGNGKPTDDELECDF